MNAADKAELLIRRRVREEDDVKLLNKRCYGIFRSMCQDAKEAGRIEEIDFTVDDLRAWSQKLRGMECFWCQRILKSKDISWDHKTPVSRGGSFSRENLAGICKVCNGIKGSLAHDEFSALRVFVTGLAKEAKADILRRLGLGARWRS